jgi:hypothetical protein
MTIHYENTEDDAIAWNRYRVLQRPRLRRLYIGSRALYVAIVTLMTFFFGVSVGAWGLLLSSLIALLIGAGSAYVSFSRLKADVANDTRKYIKQGLFHRFLGEKEVTLLPDGLKSAWDDGEITMRWSALKRWESDTTHVYLFWGEADEDFSTIPLRAFRDAEHLRQFLEALEAYRDAAPTTNANVASESHSVASLLQKRDTTAAPALPEPALAEPLAPVAPVVPAQTSVSPSSPSSKRWWQETESEKTDTTNTLRGG